MPSQNPEADARRLRETLLDLASQLRPFPAFMGMASLQAVEIEPGTESLPDRGCVVVTPEGEICQLEIGALPGLPGVVEVDQVEEFRTLDLPPEEYILYATAAIRQLTEELRRRLG